MASDGLRAELARLSRGRERPATETLEAAVAKARAVSPRELSRELQLVRGTAVRRLAVAGWILCADVRLAASVRGCLVNSTLLQLPAGRIRVEAARAAVRVLEALLTVPPVRGEGECFESLQRSFERCASVAGLRIRHQALAECHVRIAASLQRMRRAEEGLSGGGEGEGEVSVGDALRVTEEAEAVVRRARAVRHSEVHQLYEGVRALSAAVRRVRAACERREDGADGGGSEGEEEEDEEGEWEDAVVVVRDVDEQRHGQ